MTVKTSALAFVVALLCVFAAAAGPAAASSNTPGVGWEVTSGAQPTNLPRGGEGRIYIDVFNVGAAASRGVTVTDVLPPGLTATEAGALETGTLHTNGVWTCTGSAIVTCTSNPGAGTNLENADIDQLLKGGGGGFFAPQIGIAVKVSPTAASTEVNRVTVAGGGAQTPASTTAALTVSSEPAGFGFAGWDVWFSNPDGTIDTQAGSHPYAATFSINLNNVHPGEVTYNPAGGEPRNIEVQLPPGVVGNPATTPFCSRELFDHPGSGQNTCPVDTQVGHAVVLLGGFSVNPIKIYNLEPLPGVAATFAFTVGGRNGVIDSGVRGGSDYGITSLSENVPNNALSTIVVTLWGVPGDPSHSIWRTEEKPGGRLAPLLTLPTSCSTPPKFTIRANSWEHPNVYAEASTYWHASNDTPVGITGCEQLGFGPSISTAPDTTHADTPAGLTVEVTPPIGGLSDVTGCAREIGQPERCPSSEPLSTADIQNTTVTLPQGMVINPGQAAGLVACQPFQDGLTSEAERAEGKEDNAPPSCPAASKVGEVKIQTPLLEGDREKELVGNVYVLQSNPPNLELLVAASADGVNLKLVGKVHLNETGQLTTKFEGTPELPFTNFKLSFSGGAQAALATPTQCGVYTTTSDFNPWSSPFVADVFPTAPFAITSGPGGGPCPSNPLPFSPQLIAGATTDQAGGYTDFSLLLQRGDGQQRINGLRFKAPEGLTGFLSHVPLCTNAQAEANACPEASKIGHTVVESGPGPYPLVIPEPGQEPAPIYLTESYGGAPFGLSIVVPLHTGPFVLPTQRVRARIEVDPHTSALTVTTNPLPQVVAGVPTDLREIDAVIERPEFMVNPTNCSPQEFSGTAYGTPPPGQGGAGASAAISSHFQVGACQALKFAPGFSVSTSGKTSRANGASLTARVTYPSVPQGTDADIGLVKVELPKQLPSRLTTLQKACTSAQFEANPAGCPEASKIGYATVHTPLLPVVLQGPVIFVSHGGEAFPSLTIVLQGDGVTVDLVGATFISKKGITSTTFKTVPDDPFSSFELTLPEGKYSALAANGNLCAPTTTTTVKKRVTVRVKGHKKTVTRKLSEAKPVPLRMPTEFVAQNGAVLKQSTKVSVTGCTRTAKAKKAAHKANKKAKARKRNK